MKDRIIAYADRLEAKAKSFDEDTLVSMAEGIANSRIAEELRVVASTLRALVSDDEAPDVQPPNDLQQRQQHQDASPPQS